MRFIFQKSLKLSGSVPLSFMLQQDLIDPKINVLRTKTSSSDKRQIFPENINNYSKAHVNTAGGSMKKLSLDK